MGCVAQAVLGCAESVLVRVEEAYPLGHSSNGRELAKEALFDRLGLPSFFDEAVEMVMEKIKARVAEEDPRSQGMCHWGGDRKIGYGN
jgi:hypothetical protein